MGKNDKLFKAAYYADLNTIKALVETEDDLQIQVYFEQADYALYWNTGYVSVSILDILNWAAYAFYEYIEKDILCHKMFDANNIQVLNECINPSVYYQKVMDCIDWVCSKFSIINYQLKDYSKYRNFRHLVFNDEEWLDEDEISEALQRGFRQIDLDLINEAEKGNGIACYNLLKKGANYRINPDDFSNDSTIMDMLGTDMSFHMLRVISYLFNIEKFTSKNCYDMLSSLYQTGVSNYILDIIMMNEK